MRSCAANSQSHAPRRIRKLFQNNFRLIHCWVGVIAIRLRELQSENFFDIFPIVQTRETETETETERQREGVDGLLLLLQAGVVKL